MIVTKGTDNINPHKIPEFYDFETRVWTKIKNQNFFPLIVQVKYFLHINNFLYKERFFLIIEEDLSDNNDKTNFYNLKKKLSINYMHTKEKENNFIFILYIMSLKLSKNEKINSQTSVQRQCTTTTLATPK